ncbi:MAG: glycosyltransferase family 4 protein [Deltaproteobacteria bacterium]|nr:glycosyltransferase family 4 protein [Deltaproteobacteria bacterium]
MKILHINTERTWRGGEQQTLYLIRSLIERRINCHLVCQAGSPMAERAVTAGVKVFPISMRGEIDLAAGFRIRRLIKKFNYDIIHSHTSHAHSLAFLASIGSGAVRLVTRRVDFSIFRSSFLKLSGIKYRFMADHYIAISQKIKDVMVNDGIPGRRIFVVHSGIDPQRFKAATGEHLLSEFDIKEHQKVVINVAHLAGHKGQQYLVQAIPRVLAKFPDTRFFIVGKGELMENLKETAAGLGLKRELVFTGFRDDVAGFYQIADLYVMSSVQEGLGTAVLDALALAKPVVATSAGGLPEIIHDGITGRLVAPADPEALAQGIVDMLTYPDRAGSMAAAGRERVLQEFSVEAMVTKNIEVYRRILPG